MISYSNISKKMVKKSSLVLIRCEIKPKKLLRTETYTQKGSTEYFYENFISESSCLLSLTPYKRKEV